MVGPGSIVTATDETRTLSMYNDEKRRDILDRLPFWRVMSNENASCILYMFHLFICVFHVKNQMLGCVIVRKVYRLLHGRCFDDDTFGYRLAKYVHSTERTRLFVYLSFNGRK